jgi:glyoxylase-like metal-dependent hydrolase (beta-lactamase superfamily II)
LRPEVRFVDEFEGSVGWTPAIDEFRRRTSHAVASGGRVWTIDPLLGAGIGERIRGLGEPAGVVQLLDRHNRDCRALAARLRVPLHVTPFAGVDGAPFDVVKVLDVPGWHEVALWFPSERILVCADAVGSAHYFRARGERVGVHPMLRLSPPRTLARFEPRQLLLGHGEGLAGGEAAEVLHTALRTSRRRIPSWLFSLPQSRRRHQ